MNLLQRLLNEGRDLKVLSLQPSILHACFEKQDPFGLIDDDIEYTSCKLSLINSHLAAIHHVLDEAWKIALPRRLTHGIIEQLFADAASSHAILKHLTKWGCFGMENKNLAYMRKYGIYYSPTLAVKIS